MERIENIHIATIWAENNSGFGVSYIRYMDICLNILHATGGNNKHCTASLYSLCSVCDTFLCALLFVPLFFVFCCLCHFSLFVAFKRGFRESQKMTLFLYAINSCGFFSIYNALFFLSKMNFLYN